MLQPNKKNKKASVNKKYSNAKKGDSLAEDVFEIFDPTGISSYDDVYRSYKENGLLSWQTGLEALGALPIIGKAGKGIKIANTTSKYLKALSKVNKVTSKAEKVVPKILKYGKEVGKTIQSGSKAGKANPVAVASMGIGMGAEAFQKVTKVVEKVTKKGVKEIIKKAPANKRVINETVSTVNTVNTLSDVAGAVNRKEKNKEETPVESKKSKVVYYNTNPKNGKVEKPGDEEEVKYIPVSNSVQLEKWKAQNNVPVTSDLKTKVTRGVLGTVLPDQAAQFLSAIVTKDNKLGFKDLTPEQQEALIKSVKNAQKRTGKDSGGTEYIDYSPEVEKAFQGMSAGKKQMLSTDSNIQAATMLGRVSYKKNALGETEVYDSYDFSKTNPEKANTFYKKVRAYAGTALPDDGKKPNLIGKIPEEEQELAYGTDAEGIDPNKRKLFDESSMTSSGFADVGFNTSSKNFGLNAGVGFNPQNLYGRVGGSFNKKGFNASGEFTQRPEGNYGVNANAGYGNENINASLGYSKTDDNEFVTGNISAGSDKLRLIMDYLKNAEGDSINTNLSFNNEIMGASGEPVGTLNSSIGAGVNPEDTFISGALDYSTKAFQQGKGFNYNAGVNYSDLGGPNINAGVKYRFANGTNQEGIMKSKMNPRKRYANGSNLAGIANPGQIPSPSETLNDYNIMMAKADAQAMSNPWLPVVSIVGGLAQQAASMGYKFKGAGGGDTGDIVASTAGDNNSKIAAMGMNDVQQDVEVEGGEMYETPQGQVGEFQGPAHEQGGIPLEVGEDVQEGTKVYSDRLKIGKKTLAERKATRERQIANLEKQATKPNVDQAVKNALQRKMAAIQKEEDMDLQFQGQVDEMQQMADMAVQTFAYGTSMAGIQDNPIGDSMRYGYGTGAKGIKKYAVGTDDFGLLGDPPKKDFSMFPTVGMADYDTNSIKNLHDALGIAPATKGYGTSVGPATLKAYQSFATNYMKNKGYSTANSSNFPDISRFYKNDKVNLPNQGEADALGLTTEGWKFKGPEMPSQETIASLQPVPFIEPTGVLAGLEKTYQENKAAETAKKSPESKFSKVLTKLGESVPGVGDMTKLIGNYMGMTAGTKTALEQRATDVTQKNAFADAGKKAQEMYNQALQSIEGQKSQALVNNTTQRRTSQKSGRNSARGVNQMRGIDWLYNTAANKAAEDIVSNTQSQIAQLFQGKASASLNADQMKGTGQYQADMANMASKDAFYTALGAGRKDFATGLQQTGADLNSMKENKMIENLMKNYGQYVNVDRAGNLVSKNAVPTKKEEQIFLGPDGKTKFKLGKDNKLIQVT